MTRLIRLAEAERVKLAGGIAWRSEIPDESSLARRMGATGPTDLVAQVTGTTRETSGTLVRLAAAVRAREGLTGEVLPASRPHVAEALTAGHLDLEVAAALVRAMRKVENGLAPFEVDELERQLVGRAQVLDFGSSRRFFTEAQRKAMIARDGGGCTGPCCDAPTSWCDAAHLVPAGHGPTSIDNGLMLCRRCHRLLDTHGWRARRDDGRWWWTPPPWIDRTGRQRPGGRIPPIHLTA